MDADLLAQAQRGDARAMERVLAEIAPAIQRFGLRMCQHTADAEEVLQDTLLAVAQHLGDFEGRSSLTSWVFTLARTACVRRRRGKKNQPGISSDELGEAVDVAASPEERAERRELATHVAHAIDRLPESYREVLFLRDVEGLTAPEAAEALGITVQSLKSRLHRARGALKSALEPVLAEAPSGPDGCPDVATLWSKKLEGDLDAIDCAQMERHLEGCLACRARCDTLRSALAACQRYRQQPVPKEVQVQVKKAVAAWLSTQGR